MQRKEVEGAIESARKQVRALESLLRVFDLESAGPVDEIRTAVLSDVIGEASLNLASVFGACLRAVRCVQEYQKENPVVMTDEDRADLLIRRAH